jgi:hypothetical protein
MSEQAVSNPALGIIMQNFLHLAISSHAVQSSVFHISSCGKEYLGRQHIVFALRRKKQEEEEGCQTI